MPHVYKATKDGTLANPYRYVKAGETVVVEKPLKASWLEEVARGAPLPADAALPSASDAPKAAPGIVENGEAVTVGQVPKAHEVMAKPIADEAYDNNTAAIIAGEKARDEKEAKKAGSGNQEVL